MAALTGGSPFYIRNRLKDALRAGVDLAETGQGGGMAVTLHPFEGDPNRARMGEFAELTLHFVVSDKVPGHFLSLSADTPGPATGYHGTITLTDAGKGSE